MIGHRSAVFVGALLLGVAVLVMYVPRNVPEWAEERGLLKAYIIVRETMLVIAHGLSAVTGKPFLSSMKSITSFSFSYLPASEVPKSKLEFAKFDGVSVDVFRPQPIRKKSPAIVYIHGGGWSVFGSDAYRTTADYIASSYNAIVISIDYRLSPEHPYPIPFEDSLKATVHFLKNAEKFGVDPKRIALAGDSAGGNLVAAIALRLSQEDLANQLPRLKFQVLIYPVMQMMDFNTYSYNTFSNTGFLTKNMMLMMWLYYLGYPELLEHAAEFAANNHTSPELKASLYGTYIKHENLPEEYRVNDFQPVGLKVGNKAISEKIKSRLLDPYFAPLFAQDLSKVPMAYFILAQNDVLRDDGLLYMERLRKAGVKTELDFYEKDTHVFCQLCPVHPLSFQSGFKALDNLGKFVKKNL